MSSQSRPISNPRFASAVESLPLSALHSTAAEISNSLRHLHGSNLQLQPLANQGDITCREAIDENETVMRKMRERLELLKAEVHRRGMRWPESNDSPMFGPLGNSVDPSGEVHYEQRASNGVHAESHPREREEARDLTTDQEDGVHL